MLLMIPLISCDNNVVEPDPPDDDDPPEIPEKAINPSPPDGATDLPAGTDLSWEIDGDSSSYTFDIYFGTTSPPPQVNSGVVNTSYDPGALEFETTYYWRIDSVIGEETTQGDEWSFTTGAKLVRLTFNNADDWDPSWSPDGTKIVFTSDRLDEYSNDLWIVPSTGGEPELLTEPEYRDFHPDWSPDGTMIAFSSTRYLYPEICKIPAGGGEVIRVTTSRRNQTPTWSNDSTRIAFMCIDGQSSYYYRSLYVINADGTGMRWIFHREGEELHCGGPAWAPNSSRIAYYYGYYDITNIYICDADDSDYWYQVTDDDSKNGAPCWSPDGNDIAFTSDRSGDSDIWVVPSAGGTPIQITDDPAVDYSGDWSPDGTKIAFTSNRGGSFDIWVIDVSGMY
ncbi:MAG: hypothetical protein GY771_10860 [bacterium]|nr:hypothetical protein [bacterium]